MMINDSNERPNDSIKTLVAGRLIYLCRMLSLFLARLCPDALESVIAREKYTSEEIKAH